MTSRSDSKSAGDVSRVVDAPRRTETPSPRGGKVHYRCSFCNKGQEEVRRLIAGPNQVYICDECVQLCREIIEEEEPLKLRTDLNVRETLAFVENAGVAKLAIRQMRRLSTENAALLPPGWSDHVERAASFVDQQITDYFTVQPAPTEDDASSQDTPDSPETVVETVPTGEQASTEDASTVPANDN